MAVDHSLSFDDVEKAIAEIEYYQRHSDVLFLAKKPFQCLCRETTVNVSTGNENGALRWTNDALILLQTAAEKYIADTFQMRCFR